MNGVLHCMKPPGMTSSDVVVALRRLLQEKRIGHTGTLDPGAAGVLTVCIGKATRLSDFLLSLDKEYVALIRLGVATDTQDAYGQTVSVKAINVADEAIHRVLERFTGRMAQRPSVYSAIKVDGKRAYALAREGQEVTMALRSVMIHRIELLGRETDDTLLVRVTCGKGTYIRTLAHDIGEALGCGAHLQALLRTRNGCAALSDTVTLEEMASAAALGRADALLAPMDQAVAHIGAAEIEETCRNLLHNGHPVPKGSWRFREDKGETGGPLRLYCSGGFYGIGRAGEDGVLRVEKLLYDAVIEG